MVRKMKDSKNQWLKQIPADWEEKRLKSVGCFSASGIDKNVSEDEIPIGIINYTDVYNNKKHELRKKDYMMVTTTREKMLAHSVRKGDLIFTPSSETAEDIGVSALVAEELDGVAFSYHVLRFIFSEQVYDAYKKYLCNNYIVYNYYSSRAVGTIRKTLSRDVFKNTLVVIPPFEEQKRIAGYLDSVCARIDDVVEKTQVSIEEYKKLKQAIITEAVTKGISPNRKMKDSGSKWFKTIPIDWNMEKIKYIFTIKKDIAGEEGHQVLSITQKGIVPKDISKNEGQLAETYSNYQFVNIGDYAMNHMDLLTGWVDISKYEGVTSPDYRVFVLNDLNNNSNKYFLYLMQICYSNRIFYGLGQGVSGMGRWRLQTDKFKNFYIPIPPLEEQLEIVDYITEKTLLIDELIEKKERYCSEILGYKRSLIYEYITGKKSV